MSREAQSFEEFKRQKELERLKRKAQGEETGEHEVHAPKPGDGAPERRRIQTRLRTRIRSSFGI